jgi:hypothetical protein
MKKLKFDNQRDRHRYWQWRCELGRVIRKTIPKHIEIPLEQDEYLRLYKDGLTPLDASNYIMYHVMQ